MSKLKISAFEQTCLACPSQWEGRIGGKTWVYIRYRWGTLTAGIGPTLSDAVRDGRSHFRKVIGDLFHGELKTEDMQLYTHDWFDWSKALDETKKEPHD